MESDFEQEIFEIKEQLKQALKRIGGKADIEALGKEFKRKIDLKKFRYDSFCQLVRNFQDIFHIDRYTVTLKPENQSKHVLKDECFELQDTSSTINLDSENKSLLFEDSDSSSSTIYKDVQYSMKIPKDMQKFTGAQLLSDSETSEESEKEFNKMVIKMYNDASIDFSTFNNQFPCAKDHVSVEDLSSIESYDLNVNDDELEDILAKDENLEDDEHSVLSLNQFICSLPPDDEIFFSHLPAINRDKNATVPIQNIAKDFENEILYISEIFDPVHFWFQLVASDEKYENFDPFHAAFNEEYKNLKENELIISDENYTEGLIVACYVPKFKRWYRTRIIENYNSELDVVKLFFIDYGTNGISNKQHLRYLFQHYMKYPQYCFRGRIAGIVPLNNERSFKIHQIEKFIKKISLNSFYGTVVKYEPEENVYQLKLICRKGDLNIKDFMIENKYAQHMNSRENDGEFSIGPPCYLIPTFKALESDFPSYANIEKMNRSDVDFNIIIDSNFLHSYRRSDVEKNDELRVIVEDPRFSLTKKYFYGYN